MTLEEFVKKVSTLDLEEALSGDEEHDILVEIVDDARGLTANPGDYIARHGARRGGARARGAGRLGLYLYRVTELDDDGDPRDHGVVRAADMDEAAELVKLRLTELELVAGTPFRVYPLVDSQEATVIGSDTEVDPEQYEL